ncbi:BatA domain-containing protein [Mangrovivirga sp. M17]|uniref:BatA domain-containing protein n=1 Tax=Mangrovivirga halotolerans TaxID=2993936 RepID=A0ABT3RX39_9BACT|nr:BatA domain-containing protein [Mangrovivirga halotolerans]MCX2746121.1 BatA domain-containing protein [Mangrovivirga halotolerans]
MKIDWLPYGLAFSALIIPLIIHLVNRRQGKILKIGSLKFLEGKEVQKARSIKLHEVILMLLRMVLILLLVFYFLDPAVRGIKKVNFKPAEWIVGDSLGVAEWLKKNPSDSVKKKLVIREQNLKDHLMKKMIRWNNSDTLPESVIFLADWKKKDIARSNILLEYNSFLANPFVDAFHTQKYDIISAAKDSIKGKWVYEYDLDRDSIYFEITDDISIDTLLYVINIDSSFNLDNEIKNSIRAISKITGVKFLEIANEKVADLVFYSNHLSLHSSNQTLVLLKKGTDYSVIKTGMNTFDLYFDPDGLETERGLLFPYYVSLPVLRPDTITERKKIDMYKFGRADNKLRKGSRIIESNYSRKFKPWLLTAFLIILIFERFYAKKVGL